MVPVRFTLLCLSLVMGLCIGLVPAGPAMAKRLALVVGIDGYRNVPVLQKARNDARAVGQALQASGFDVLSGIDVSRRDFFILLNDFYNRVSPGDEVVFFFAGHGVLLDGRNRLLPADVPVVSPGNETLLAYESLAADEILDEIQRRGARVSFLILDACRNNPFPQSGQRSVGGARGLGRMDAPEGAFILYSAGTGQTALDRLSNADSDPNSVFTRALLPLMSEPGLGLHDIARQVRNEVRAMARSVNHDQFPAYYDQLSGDFFVRQPADRGAFTISTAPATADAPPQIPETQAVPPVGDPCSGAVGHWEVIASSSSASVFELYIERYKACPMFVALATERIEQLKGPSTPTKEAPALPDTTMAAASSSGAPQSVEVGVGVAAGAIAPAQPAPGTSPVRPAAVPAPVVSPVPQVAPSPVPSGDVCFDLWYQRNAIFHDYGYCFQTDKAKQYFDVSSCKTRSPNLNAFDLTRVETIRARERASGC